jgi:hypothetical protein
MFCEITITHKKAPTEDELKSAIQKALGKEIPLSVAYERSEIFRGLDPPETSLFAVETVHRCFVIARWVNFDSSNYHLEGNSPKVSIESRRLAAQEFSATLTSVLRTNKVNPNFKARKISLIMLEDNGQETGVEGGVVTFGSILREKLAYKEIKSDLISFVTAALLIWLGLKKDEPWKAILYSAVITAVFILADIVSTYWRNSGKIVWTLRQT